METKQDALNWITEFLKDVDSQDNRCTAKPVMFLLQTKNEYVANDDYYGSEAREVYRSHSLESHYDSEEECIQALQDYGFEGARLEKEIEDIEVFHMGYHWDTQEVCFTKTGIDRHLALNKHNYRNGHRDFVIHAFRNPEIHELFDALRLLVKPDVTT